MVMNFVEQLVFHGWRPPLFCLALNGTDYHLSVRSCQTMAPPAPRPFDRLRAGLRGEPTSPHEPALSAVEGLEGQEAGVNFPQD